MISSVTHFEIYGEEPSKLAEFYGNVFGWQIEQMPGVNYWRIHTCSTEAKPLHGGLTYRAIPDLNGWMLFVNVASLDETVALVQKLGGGNRAPQDCRAEDRLGDNPCRPREKHLRRLAGGSHRLPSTGTGLNFKTSPKVLLEISSR